MLFPPRSRQGTPPTPELPGHSTRKPPRTPAQSLHSSPARHVTTPGRHESVRAPACSGAPRALSCSTRAPSLVRPQHSYASTTSGAFAGGLQPVLTDSPYSRLHPDVSTASPRSTAAQMNTLRSFRRRTTFLLSCLRVEVERSHPDAGLCVASMPVRGKVARLPYYAVSMISIRLRHRPEQ